MFEKEIGELLELTMRVVNETEYFVAFEIAAHTRCCYISIHKFKVGAWKGLRCSLRYLS